jgi:hypothetical protein
MKLSELRKLIREEVRKVVNEATLISKGTKAGAPAEIKVNDYVQWTGTENDRGMRVATGTYIGKVVKILGSKNMQVEVVFPLTDEGDMYKVAKEESKRIPVVGEMISAKYSWNGGQGSGSQGSSTLTGTVTKVDLTNAKITVKNQEGKSVTAPIRDLSDIMISK